MAVKLTDMAKTLIVPVLAFFVFSVWMISEAKKDDDQIGAFIGLLFLLWVIGIVLLAVSYLSRYL